MSQNKSNKVTLLSAALIVQVVIAVFVFWQYGSQKTADLKPLLSVNYEEVNKLIVNTDGKEMVVEKQSGRWLVEGLPVDSSRMDLLLKKFGDINQGWPVANSKSALERFELADDNYRRKVQLMKDDKALATLYLGSAVSTKQARIRKAGENEIYTANISEYEFPDSLDSWLDSGLLQVKSEITAISSGEFKVSKDNGQWPKSETDVEPEASSPPADDEVAKADSPATEPAFKFNAEQFAEILSSLYITGVEKSEINEDVKELKEDGAQSVAFHVTTRDAEYEYEMLKKGDRYFIRRNDYDVAFIISKYNFDNLAAIADKNA